MGVVYRSMWQDTRPELVEVGRDIFTRWARAKHPEMEIPDEGEGSLDGITIRVRRAADEETRALRMELVEEDPDNRWSTMLTLMERDDERVGWLDLDWVSEDVYARPPDLASPRVVRDLVAAGTTFIGSDTLRTDARLVTSDGVSALLDEVTKEDREIPIVVFGVATGQYLDAVSGRAEAAAEALAGVANVCMIVPTALHTFNKALGADLSVHGGAVRTYLPGVTPDHPNPYRHRFLTRSRIERHRRSAANALTRALFSRAAVARPPQLYRSHVQPLLEARLDDGEAAQELVDEMDVALTTAQEQLEAVKDELELEQLMHEEALGNLENANVRIRFLEARVAESGVPQYGIPTPEEDAPLTAETCEQAVSQAQQHLDLLVFCDGACEEVQYLDGFPNTLTWAKKAWMSFRALQAYAEGKADDSIASDFKTAVDNGELGTFGIPTTWVAMSESETTDQNAAYRNARTFPVSTRVDASGTVYMPAHVKLQQGGTPIPRIHFHDDTSGATGRIHVGWFGSHLENKSTN